MGYEDRKPKYVIVDDEFRWGRVIFHSDLLRENEKDDMKGGGWFHISHDNKKVYFFGTSIDFGPVTKEQFEEADKWRIPNIDDWELIWLGPEYPRLVDVANHFNCTVEEL